QVEPEIQLHHFAVGEGRSVLVIHGGPGMPYQEPWPALAPLTDDYRFHFYDQRGAGQSTRPFDRFTTGNFYQNMTTLEQTLGIGAQLADIERIRQLLGDEQLILIGHSWGGFLATLYAAEFPGRVAALILLAPADMLLMPQEGDDLFAAVRQRLPAARQAEYDAYMKEYLNFGAVFSKSEADLQAANRQFGEYYGLAIGQELGAVENNGGWMVQAMYFSIGQRHDYRPTLAQITAPTLVLHGAADLQSTAISQGYVDGIVNAQLAVIPAAGHFLFADQPATFATVVQAFLSETGQ
ncbi:MAG: alpha/beta hydrolase, partial [Caldilineaceae bacterium]|nr:alpha/beta hydrolase [Caldilineaceae bacterium]